MEAYALLGGSYAERGHRAGPGLVGPAINEKAGVVNLGPKA